METGFLASGQSESLTPIIHEKSVEKSRFIVRNSLMKMVTI